MQMSRGSVGANVRDGLIGLAGTLGLGFLLWRGLTASRDTKRRARRAKGQPPASKTIDGKRYSQHIVKTSKAAADAEAKKLRAKGKRARVVPGKIRGTNSRIYVVFTR